MKHNLWKRQDTSNNKCREVEMTYLWNWRIYCWQIIHSQSRTVDQQPFTHKKTLQELTWYHNFVMFIVMVLVIDLVLIGGSVMGLFYGHGVGHGAGYQWGRSWDWSWVRLWGRPVMRKVMGSVLICWLLCVDMSVSMFLLAPTGALYVMMC